MSIVPIFVSPVIAWVVDADICGSCFGKIGMPTYDTYDLDENGKVKRDADGKMILKKMGYGNFDGTTVTKRSADGGIDGVVYQDVLGLDIVYVQAKRYREDIKIGSPDLQKFCGALSGKQALKGIFFTTSDFSKEALEYLKTTPQKIIPVNGSKLLDLMIKFGVGTETSTSYETYRIDEDYFSE